MSRDIETGLLFENPDNRDRTESISEKFGAWLDAVFFQDTKIIRDHVSVRSMEMIVFTISLSVAAIVLGMFEMIEPYEKIEIYSVSLLVGYTALQYFILRKMCDAMLPFADTVTVNVKYVAIIIILLILALVASMTVHLKYSDPIEASISMALAWRFGISISSLIISYRIDSFFGNYNRLLRIYIDHWDGWDVNERRRQLQKFLIVENNTLLTKVNKYSYIGFFVCCLAMIFSYTILYYFDDSICHKINLIMYCAFVFVTCSTNFLLRMCELTKQVNQLPVAVRDHIKIKIKFLHWEPSGDLMVGYALGLLFKVFTNLVLALSGSC